MRFTSFILPVLSLASFAVAGNFSNPLKDYTGSDPFIVTYEGYYYLLTTTWDDLQITRATTLEGLKTGENKVVWTEDPARTGSVWAPEVHLIDGTWYLYFSAPGRTDADKGAQFTYVLTGGSSPWDDFPADTIVQMTTEWGIDSTVLRYADYGNYLVWSCFPEPDEQSLCTAPLETPTKLGPRTVISRPTNDWERIGAPPAVNEGPAGLYHGGRTFIVYSASFCWTTSYSLAYLEWNGGDPTDEASWSKTGPVFSSANGNYGTAHNGFFTSPDGSEIWNVYHATADTNGNCARDRYTMAQILNWNEDGSPNFGTPVPKGEVFEGPAGEP